MMIDPTEIQVVHTIVETAPAVQFHTAEDGYFILGWIAGIRGLVDGERVVQRGHEHHLRYETELDRSRGDALPEAQAFLTISTAAGLIRVDRGDWVVYRDRVFQPVQADTFEQLYEPVSA
jgi:hypothetical protein